jgi:hypothetical protein
MLESNKMAAVVTACPGKYTDVCDCYVARVFPLEYVAQCNSEKAV